MKKNVTQDDVKSYFENKRIAVVGNALSLFEQGYGNDIDACDIVVRFNLGCLDLHVKRQGLRTDWVVYNNFQFAVDNNLFSVYDQNNKVKFLQLTYDSTKNIQRNNIYTKYNINIIDKSNLQELYNLGFKKPKGPSTGTQFLYFLSKIEYKEVLIFGFDWKETPTYYNKTRKWKKEKMRNTKLNDWKFERKFVLNLCSSDSFYIC